MKKEIYDAIVIGGGPAGLTAALYLARARYRVLVVEKEKFGGQITITSEVVNYPGVETASGEELTAAMRRQAQRFGAEFLLAEVEALELEGDVKTVRTSRGVLSCFGVLLATGAHPRKIGFQGEAEFKGRGVAYCATCDGEFFTGLDVFVVGGGFAAAEEAVFLTRYARSVTILMVTEDFTCAQAVAEPARNHEKIRILTRTAVEEAGGDTALRYLRYRNLDTGEVTEYRPEKGETFGLFVFAGYEPATGLVKDLGVLDGQGYVVTDENQKTAVDGLYAAGDVCVKNLRQVVTAVGDGAKAATELEKYAREMQEKTGIRPVQPVSRLGGGAEAGKREGAGGETAGGVSGGQPTGASVSGGILTEEMKAQLAGLFGRMEGRLTLKLHLDGRPVSEELRAYMEELASLTDRLRLETAEGGDHLPFVAVCREDGTETGLAFHGVPGGHEFNSFVIGLYNAAGPGQALDEETLERIRGIRQPVAMDILVSLSCTMCPDLVMAAQRIAAGHPEVSAHVYDLNHFPDLREKYRVMSVPCLAVNGEKLHFGRKNVSQLLDILEGTDSGGKGVS